MLRLDPKIQAHWRIHPRRVRRDHQTALELVGATPEQNAFIPGRGVAPGIVQRRRIPGDGGTAGQAPPYPWQNPEFPPADERAAVMEK